MRLPPKIQSWPWILLLITIVGAALRFYMLGAKSFWIDEASSVTFARLPWREFVRTMWYGEANMAFYYFLLRGWLHLGDSEFWLRSLSCLFGLATIPAVYQFGNRFFSQKTGLAAAALLAFHGFHIEYSQELRSYSLVALLMVLSTYAFLAAIEAPARKDMWLLYAVLGALAIYAQVLAVFCLAGQWLVFTPRIIKRVGLVTLFRTAATMGVLAAPIAVVMLRENHGQLNWVPHPTVRGVVDTLQALAGTTLTGSQTTIHAFILLILYVASWIFAVASLIRVRPEKEKESSAGAAVCVAALWLFFPIAAMLAVSFVKPILYPRYLLMCAPAGVLLAARGLAALDELVARGRLFFSAGPLMMIMFSLVGTFDYFKGVKA